MKAIRKHASVEETGPALLHQAGAIPFREEAGVLRVLLVTSRGTRRWLVPKGGIEPGQSAAMAAAAEAFEEAGVSGVLDPVPLGSFRYLKRLRNGTLRPALVEVFALRVVKQARDWPERRERRAEWVSIGEAVARVQDAGLAALIERLAETARAVP